MPFRLRYLKGVHQDLIDPKAIPGGHVLLNPSIAGNIIYIRDIQQTRTQQINHVLLHDQEKGESNYVPLPLELMQPTDGLYAGLEDLRIIWYHDRLYFTATSTHASKRYQSEMFFGVFSEDLKKIERMDYIDLGKPPIKNICPFVHADKIYLVDMYKREFYEVEDDTTLFTVKLYGKLRGIPLKIFHNIEDNNEMGLRGTTSPIHLHGNTYGTIVHDVIYDHNTVLHTTTKLIYLHMWVEFEMCKDGATVTFTSSPFFVQKVGIEFVSGIQYDPAENKISLYLGEDDKIPKVVHTNLNELRV
jgi:hypothetical protein